jgi:sulfhydrogenase subunit beta (sulfur reductase)
MTESLPNLGVTISIEKIQFDQLLSNLAGAGFETIGPLVKNETIVYGRISRLIDLPQGYRSEQAGGHYRLIKTNQDRYFDITPGPNTWKQFLFPPRSDLVNFHRNGNSWEIGHPENDAPRYAFIGVRPCELAAIQIQDRVFMRSEWNDPVYRFRRQKAFLLVVNCLYPGDTCFCASMGTGPAAESGFDLGLTELEDVFLIQVGSETGRSMLASLRWETASAYWMQLAKKRIETARESMGREITDVAEVPQLLRDNLEHSRWKDTGERCLGCTNCTQVCPTCFCWDVVDHTDLLGKESRRERVWDSCFNPTFSYVFGGNTRPNIRARYRQWLTHKLGSWVDQFGTSGCVGCGRCITWCPVGIDLTEEVRAIRESD